MPDEGEPPDAQPEPEQHTEEDLRRLSSSVGSHSGHYNPHDSVVTRIEHLSERGMKAIIVRPCLRELAA